MALIGFDRETEGRPINVEPHEEGRLVSVYHRTCRLGGSDDNEGSFWCHISGTSRVRRGDAVEASVCGLSPTQDGGLPRKRVISCQLSVISYQLSVISYQLSVVSEEMAADN